MKKITKIMSAFLALAVVLTSIIIAPVTANAAAGGIKLIDYTETTVNDYMALKLTVKNTTKKAIVIGETESYDMGLDLSPYVLMPAKKVTVKPGKTKTITVVSAYKKGDVLDEEWGLTVDEILMPSLNIYYRNKAGKKVYSCAEFELYDKVQSWETGEIEWLKNLSPNSITTVEGDTEYQFWGEEYGNLFTF